MRCCGEQHQTDYGRAVLVCPTGGGGEHCVGTDVFEFKKQATHLIRALSDNEGFVL